MVFILVRETPKKWRKSNVADQLPYVIADV